MLRQKLAIIDIGSNSIRLVIYRDSRRASEVLYSEKLTCALGQELGNNGILPKKALDKAYAALARFRTICEAARVEHYHIFATAAAREAKDASEFLTKAEEILAQKIVLLSGEEEAYYGSLAICSSFYRPTGLMGDMGGGSLELAPVNFDKIFFEEKALMSFPLGSLVLKAKAKKDFVKARQVIQEALKSFPYWQDFYNQNFYAIGGVWRNIAQLYMYDQKYPLKNLHAYSVCAKELDHFLRKTLLKPGEMMAALQNIAKKRRTLLPYGALLLSEIISTMRPKEIVFSAAGVRDGYFYHLLSPQQQQKDPFLEAAKNQARNYARSLITAPLLAAWLRQSLTSFDMVETVCQRRERRAFCYFSTVFWPENSFGQANYVASWVIHGSFYGASHKSRAFIALVMFFLHKKGFIHQKSLPNFAKILSSEDIKRAKLLALLWQIGNNFVALGGADLSSLSWHKEGKGLTLAIPKKLLPLWGEKLNEWCKLLAKLCQKPITIRAKP